MKITRTAAGATIETSEGTVTVDGATVTFSPPPKMTIGEVPKPAPAPWDEALKPGDKYEVNLGDSERPDWRLRTFVRRCEHGLISKEGAYASFIRCRPLSTPAVDEAAKLRAEVAAKDRRISELESRLRGEAATVKEQAEYAVERARRHIDEIDAKDAEIAKLRALALVVPDDILGHHPLPWTALREYIRDANSSTVCAISLCACSNEQDFRFASAIVAAANGGAK